MIQYNVGVRSTRRKRNHPILIVPIVNDRGGWGRGFTGALSKQWKDPERLYRKWAGQSIRLKDSTEAFLCGTPFELGSIQGVPVKSQNAPTMVVNILAQSGYKGVDNPVAVRYKALERCLEKVKLVERQKELVVMPRIGCGVAGAIGGSSEV